MTPRLLSDSEFRKTFSSRMIDIQGREDAVQPQGVIDLQPYLEAIPDSDFAGLKLLSEAPAAAVYRSEDGRFDHVLYPCNRSNIYLVVVVGLRPDRVHGHYILNLGKEYGVEGGRLTSA